MSGTVSKIAQLVRTKQGSLGVTRLMLISKENVNRYETSTPDDPAVVERVMTAALKVLAVKELEFNTLLKSIN